MSFLQRAGLALAIAGAATAAAAKTLTSCQPGETIVFSCGAGAHIASICASKDAAKDQGTMQYRFGSAAKLELAFPAAAGRPGENFKGGWLSYSGGGGAYLRFSNGPFEYTAFTATGKWGVNGAPLDVAGVAIRKDGKDFSNFVCRDAAGDVGELGPDLLTKMGMSPPDPDVDFAPPDAFFKK